MRSQVSLGTKSPPIRLQGLLPTVMQAAECSPAGLRFTSFSMVGSDVGRIQLCVSIIVDTPRAIGPSIGIALRDNSGALRVPLRLVSEVQWDKCWNNSYQGNENSNPTPEEIDTGDANNKCQKNHKGY